MRIGEAARASGLTVKAIRHYEAVGLLPDVRRVGSYRDYSAGDLERLSLIGHCRSLGFGLDEIGEILGLVSDAAPACPPVDAMAQIIDGKLRGVRAEIAALERRADRLEAAARHVAARREA